MDDTTRLELLTALHEDVDVLLANDRSIAEARTERFAPGTPAEAMLNYWVDVGNDQAAMLSMRFEGLDVTKPFVDASPMRRRLEPGDLPGVAAAAREIYGVHKPRYVRLWSAEPIDAFPGTRRDRRCLGAPIEQLRQRDVPAGLALVPASTVDHYEEVEQAYAAVDRDHPAHVEQASPPGKENLQTSAEQGLLFEITVDGVWAGYSAAMSDSEDTLGLPAYVVRELILAPAFRGRGLGASVNALLARSLPESSFMLLGDVHADNRGARTAALAAGRQDIGGWLTLAL
ncbi:hypothetical protein [Kribbella flavida]|uniref:hypothetical protein n=1 Tax=Kribbella flavida TaxID=182640 RepID=UPI00019BD150|nr:hypothetical protein [Kribbella flavida]